VHRARKYSSNTCKPTSRRTGRRTACSQARCFPPEPPTILYTQPNDAIRRFSQRRCMSNEQAMVMPVFSSRRRIPAHAGRQIAARPGRSSPVLIATVVQNYSLGRRSAERRRSSLKEAACFSTSLATERREWPADVHQGECSSQRRARLSPQTAVLNQNAPCHAVPTASLPSRTPQPADLAPCRAGALATAKPQSARRAGLRQSTPHSRRRGAYYPSWFRLLRHQAKSSMSEVRRSPELGSVCAGSTVRSGTGAPPQQGSQRSFRSSRPLTT